MKRSLALLTVALAAAVVPAKADPTPAACAGAVAVAKSCTFTVTLGSAGAFEYNMLIGGNTAPVTARLDVLRGTSVVATTGTITYTGGAGVTGSIDLSDEVTYTPGTYTCRVTTSGVPNVLYSCGMP